MDERDFLDRLRARPAVSRDRESDPLPPAPALGMADLVESVKQNGMTFAAADASSLADAVARAAGAAKSFACWRTPALASVPARLSAAGLAEVVYPAPPADPRPAIDRSELGIVEAELMIAETGSIGLVPGPDRGLLVALLARTLVVVMREATVLSRLDDIAPWIARRSPVNLSLVSGPSRTGDIAQKHILGAHGPAAIHVIALR